MSVDDASLTPERWRRISELLDRVLSLAPEARAAFLRSAKEPDPEIRQRVAALAEAADREPGFVDLPVLSRAAWLLHKMAEQDEPTPAGSSEGEPTVDAHELALHASARIGRYRLLEKLGEGGMGEVWLAEQTEPVRRRVALKVIKAGMDTRRVIARFEAERQALALMDHACIARVFDAGATPRGLPYFVMEHVQGHPITSYCDRNRLSTRSRLELFLEVCEAVQHAHQKGIIHRDLKPSNLLVTNAGDRPLPKIIDFGVAKATAQPLTKETLFTELGALIGTPAYMSPEQADLGAVDVDTRSDVYSLGVVLYELLTGQLPFDLAAMKQASFDEIRRMIREHEPPRPSSRARSSGERSEAIARDRRTEPARLVGRLRGDLDWIVMKSLEKDRARRYSSPSDLAADIRRHLHDQPVLAGPPSAVYRAGKFVRRHRFGVAVSALGVVALVAVAGALAVQARRIALQRDRAERVSSFLVDLFKVSDPSEARGNSITAREVLDRGAEQVEAGLGDTPELEADLADTLGKVYGGLGLFDRAESLQRRTLEIRTRLLGPDDPRTLGAARDLAGSLQRQGRFAEAEKLAREVLQAQQRVLGPEHRDTLGTMHNLGMALMTQGHQEEAAEIFRQVAEARRRVLGADDPDTLKSLNNLAYVHKTMGRLDEAEKLLREIVASKTRVLGEDHPSTLNSCAVLGDTLQLLGRFEQAEATHRKNFEIRRRVLGPEHHETLDSMQSVASALHDMGRLEEAEDIVAQVLALRRKVQGAEHPETITALNLLGAVYVDERRFEEAARTFREVMEIRRGVLGPEHPDTLAAMNNVAEVDSQRGRLEDAERLLRQTLEIKQRTLAPDHVDIIPTMENLGLVCAARGRTDEGKTYLLDALERERRSYGATHPETLRTLVALANLSAGAGDRDAALDWLRQAVDGGWNEIAVVDTDPRWRSLRSDPEVSRLLARARP